MHGNRHDYDVVCIGGGGAGVTAAVYAAAQGARVALISKEPVGYGNSRLGVIMLVPGVSPGDNKEEYLRDVLRVGGYINSLELAEILAKEASFSASIVEGLGHLFPRDERGSISGRLASRWDDRFPRRLTPRVASGGGNPYGHALRAAVARSGVEVFEETVVTKLLVANRQFEGLVCFNLVDGDAFVLKAKAGVLATGGLGWLYYPHTHNTRSTTGDGYALALASGAELVDMEFVFWRPLSITHPKGLIGLGCNPVVGRLVDSKGKVVIENLTGMALGATVRAMALALHHGGGSKYGGLTVDFSPFYNDEGIKRLERLEHEDIVRKAWGEKASKREAPWDVAPTEAVEVGGIRINRSCESTIPGLYAAGEVAGGVHGALKMVGNALTEIYVFGRRAGCYAAEGALVAQPRFTTQSEADEEVGRLKTLFGAKGNYRPIKLKRELQKVMWENVGVLRTEESLRKALQSIQDIAEKSSDLSIADVQCYNLEVLDAIELGLMLETARALAVSALERRESRGGHWRLDYPDQDDKHWRKNVVTYNQGGQLKVKLEDVQYLPMEVASGGA